MKGLRRVHLTAPETAKTLAGNMSVSSSCAYCHLASKSLCSPCGTRYCGRACQKAHWPSHRAACGRACGVAKKLRARGVPASASAEILSLLADPPAVAYSGPKGRGLRALRHLPAGSCVGYIVGPDVGGDKGIETFRDYSYLWEDVVGDVARERILPECVNASLLNDSMPAEAYAALLEEGPLAFIKAYPMKLPCISLERVPGADSGRWGAYRAVTLTPIAAGAALETFYGPHYWLNHLASATFPGTRFAAAWEANRIITRGGREFQEALVRSSLGDLPVPPEDRALIIQSSLIEGIPVWLRDQGITMVYCGVGGVDYFPIDPKHKAAVSSGGPGYVVAPWAPAAMRAPGATEAEEKACAVRCLYEGVVSVILVARGICRQLGLAAAPPPTRAEALTLIARDMAEALRGVTLGVAVETIARIVIDSPGSPGAPGAVDAVDAVVASIRERGASLVYD